MRKISCSVVVEQAAQEDSSTQLVLDSVVPPVPVKLAAFERIFRGTAKGHILDM